MQRNQLELHIKMLHGWGPKSATIGDPSLTRVFAVISKC
jgi:hypothetical protein